MNKFLLKTGLIVLLVVLLSAFASAAWWNTSWMNKYTFTYTCNDAKNCTNEFIALNYSNATNCDVDLRVVYMNTSVVPYEINDTTKMLYFFVNGTYNTANTNYALFCNNGDAGDASDDNVSLLYEPCDTLNLWEEASAALTTMAINGTDTFAGRTGYGSFIQGWQDSGTAYSLIFTNMSQTISTGEFYATYFINYHQTDTYGTLSGFQGKEMTATSGTQIWSQFAAHTAAYNSSATNFPVDMSQDTWHILKIAVHLDGANQWKYDIWMDGTGALINTKMRSVTWDSTLNKFAFYFQTAKTSDAEQGRLDNIVGSRYNVSIYATLGTISLGAVEQSSVTPVISAHTISPATIYDSTNADCVVTAYGDTATLTANITWWNGTKKYLNEKYDILNNTQTSVSTITFGDSDLGENWTCEIFVNSTTLSSTVSNASFIVNGVKFNFSQPANIDIWNVLPGIYYNVTYKYYSTLGYANNTVVLYAKTNTTQSDISYSYNGTSISGYISNKWVFNNSYNLMFRLSENGVYRGTYNKLTDDITAHSELIFGSSAEYIGQQILNISNSTHYNIVEFMINSTGTGSPPLTVRYCNQSFLLANGNNPATSTNCGVCGAMAATTGYAHTHSIYSSHNNLTLPVNITTGTLCGIKNTANGTFIFSSSNPNSWTAYYTTTAVRLTSYGITNNNGNTWTNNDYTLDMHLHQYSNESIHYDYACYTDANGLQCSKVRLDPIDIGMLPPVSPTVIEPEEKWYSTYVNITWLPSYSLTGQNISYYNLSFLYASNGSVAYNLGKYSTAQTSLGYCTKDGTIDSGQYLLRVKVVDNESQTNFGLSSVFNYSYSVNITATYPTSLLKLNTSTIAFNCSTVRSNTEKIMNVSLLVYNTTTLVLNQTLNGSFIGTITLNETLVDSLNYSYVCGVMYGDIACKTYTNSTAVKFYLDATPPIVNITGPYDMQKFNDSTVPVNYTINYTVSDNFGPIDTCSYSLDGGIVTNIISCANFSLQISSFGTHTLTIYANDTYGSNTGYDSVTFFVGAMAVTFNLPNNNILTNNRYQNLSCFVNPLNGYTSSADIFLYFAGVLQNSTSYVNNLRLDLDYTENSSTTVLDDSGYDNDGTIHKATWTSSGKIGGAYSFNGNSTSGQTLNITFINLTQGFTVSTWFKANTVSLNNQVLMSNDGTSSNRAWALLAHSTNIIRLYIYSGGGGTPTVASSYAGFTWSPGTWYHAAGVYNGSEIIIYVNGIPGTAVAFSGTMLQTSRTIKVGGLDTAQFFNGTIDETKIWNKALSATEIQEEYRKGSMILHLPMTANSTITATDYSSANNSGTISDAIWTSSGKYGGAYSFDGTNKINLTKNDLIDSTDFTLSTWVKTDAISGINGQQVLFHTCDATGGMYWRIDKTTGIQRLCLSDGAVSISTLVSNSDAGTGTWQYITVSADIGNEVRFYLNGIPDGNMSIATLSGTIDRPAEIFSISHSTDGMNGTIDEVKIWNRVLNDTEIASEYATRFFDYKTKDLYIAENVYIANEGNNTWYCSANSTDMSIDITGNRTLIADFLLPSINITNPPYDYYTYTANTTLSYPVLSFNFSITDSSGVSDYNWTLTLPNQTVLFNTTPSGAVAAKDFFGIWILNVSAIDATGNINTSTRNFATGEINTDLRTSKRVFNRNFTLNITDKYFSTNISTANCSVVSNKSTVCIFACNNFTLFYCDSKIIDAGPIDYAFNCGIYDLTGLGTEGQVEAYFSCVDNNNYTFNGTKYNVWIDTVTPYLYAYKFTDNQTLRKGQNISGTWNFTDSNLYRINVTVDGSSIYELNDINTTWYEFNMSYNTSAFSLGNHSLKLNIYDSHTALDIAEYNVITPIVEEKQIAKSIAESPDVQMPALDTYEISKPLLTNKLIFETTEKNIISIEATDEPAISIASPFETERLKDRYAFIYKPSEQKVENYNFKVTTKEPMHIIEMPNTYLKKWIISGNNWIDFYSPDADSSKVEINILDDYTAEITVYKKAAITEKLVEEMDEIPIKDEMQFYSIGDLNHLQLNYTFYTYDAQMTFDSSVIESEMQTTTLEMNFNGSLSTGLKVWFEYDGVNKSLVTNYNTSGPAKFIVSYNATFGTPEVSSTVTKQGVWYYSFDGYNLTQLSFNQTVYDIGITTNCSIDNASRVLTFYGFDEVTNATVQNMSLDLNLDVWVGDVSLAADMHFMFRNNTNYTICIYPNTTTYKAYAIMEYGDDVLYTHKKFYLLNYTLSASDPEDVYLYHLNKSSASEILVTIIDAQTGAYIENAYVKVLRYYPGENEYKLVEVEATDANGKAITKQVLYDVFYKYIVEYPAGTIRLTTSVAKLTSVYLTLPISLSAAVLQDWEKVADTNSKLNCSSKTATCSFTWSSVTGETVTGVLKTYEDTGLYEKAINTSTLSSSAGQLSLSIPSYSNNTKYIAKAYLISDGKEYFIDSAQMFVQENVFSKSSGFRIAALIPLILLTISIIALLLDFGVIGVVLGSLVGMLVGMGTTIIPVNIPGLISMVILAGILVWKLGRN